MTTDVKYTDADAVSHSLETEAGTLGGSQSRPVHGLPASVVAHLQNTADRLSTLITNLGTLSGVAALLTTIDGHVDGLEGFTDGIEGKLDTVHTDLVAVEGFVDGIEGFLNTLAGAISSAKMQSDVITLPAPAASIFSGQGSVGTSHAALASSQALKHGVWVRNLHATNVLYIGAATVTSANGYKLNPGEEKFLPVANLATVDTIGSAASTTFCYLAS